MSKPKQRYDEDFKKNAVKLSYASPKTVAEIAEDLRIAWIHLKNIDNAIAAIVNILPHNINVSISAGCGNDVKGTVVVQYHVSSLDSRLLFLNIHVPPRDFSRQCGVNFRFVIKHRRFGTTALRDI
jgi:hypothetical protein